MTRWKAASIHLAISLSVVSILTGGLALTWYPVQYVQAVGGLGLIAIVFLVDVCLGPLLTLIVFDIKKARLKFDLCFIATCQVVAFIYGLYSVAVARPVFIVFALDRFEIVAAADLSDKDLATARLEEFKSLSWTGPEIIGIDRPADSKERKDVLFSAALGGPDYPQMPKYYVPYSSVAKEACNKARPVEELAARGDEPKAIINRFLKNKVATLSDVKYLPLAGRHRDQTVLLDAKSGAVLGVVDVLPWENS